MQLRSMFARNYRSLRSIRMDLADVNLFIGENGVGKSNLYRSLQLVQAAVRGRLAHEISSEGGMFSAMWSGKRRSHESPRIRFDVELLDMERAATFRYWIEAGMRPPGAAGFSLEPEIKAEELSFEGGRRPVTMMKREGAGISVRGETGRMEAYREQALPSETAIALLGDAGHYPEIGTFRRAVDAWRFFHGFRTDRGSPLRAPCLAVTSPMLDEDGANIAAVFATLAHIRGDTVELDRVIATALGRFRADVARVSQPRFPAARIIGRPDPLPWPCRRPDVLSTTAADRAQRAGGELASRYAAAACRYDRAGGKDEPDLDRHPFRGSCSGRA